jgi:hypothetical protein
VVERGDLINHPADPDAAEVIAVIVVPIGSSASAASRVRMFT